MPEDNVKKVEKVKDDTQNPEKIDNEVKQVSEFEKEELFDPNNVAALIDKSKEEAALEVNKTNEITQDQFKNFEDRGNKFKEIINNQLREGILGC